MSFGLIPATPRTKISFSPPELIRLLEIFGTSCCKGTPSTTHKGSASPLSVFVPRILTLADSPGRPETAITLTPATCPCNNISTVGMALFVKASSPIVAVDPVERSFVVCPYPVMITSSNWSTFSFITTRNGLFTSVTFTSCVSIPTNENSRNISFCSGIVI